MSDFKGIRAGELNVFVVNTNVNKSRVAPDEWVYTVYDKDGDEAVQSEDTYETQVEAESAAQWHYDEFYYGSHEVYKL